MKLYEEKVAREGYLLIATIEGETITAPRVTAPIGTDLSEWKEITIEDYQKQSQDENEM